MTGNRARVDALTGLLIKAAKSKKSDGQVAVYDANGRLVGLVDPDDLQPVAQADASAAAPKAAPAQAAQPAASQPAQEAVEGVTKAVEMARFHPDTDVRVEVRKAGATAGTLAAQFDAVCTSMPDFRDRRRVQDAVGLLAANLAIGHGIPSAKAVSIAKTAAVRAAQAKAANPQPDTLAIIQGRLGVAGR